MYDVVHQRYALDAEGKNWSKIKLIARFLNDSSTGPQIATDYTKNITYVYWSRGFNTVADSNGNRIDHGTEDVAHSVELLQKDSKMAQSERHKQQQQTQQQQQQQQQMQQQMQQPVGGGGGVGTKTRPVIWKYVSFWGAKSTDNGNSWSNFNVSAANPLFRIQSPGGGGAFQLPDGRLVMACNDAGKPTVCHTSDGMTFERGSPIPLPPGLGEYQLIWDGRGPESVALFLRIGAAGNGLVNHALALSPDLGKTWTPLSHGSFAFLPELQGCTNQGSIARDPLAAVGSGKVLLSAPMGTDASLNGRRNLTVWSLQLPPLGGGSIRIPGGMARDGVAAQSAVPTLAPKVVANLWRLAASYSSFTADGEFNLFEGGLKFRYQSLMLANTSNL